MRRTQLLYDGLWRCLCPAFDEHALSRALTSSFPRQNVRRYSTKRSFPHSWLKQASTAEAPTPEVDSSTSEADLHLATPPPRPATPFQSSSSTKEDTPKSIKAAVDELLQTGKTQDESNEVIVAALEALRSTTPSDLLFNVQHRHYRIVKLVRFLILERKYPINAFIYECMMDAMVDPKGSSSGVSALFADMAKQKIPPTERICHSALQALAIHPDYVLRHNVLDIMQHYWFPTDTSLQLKIMLAMLREGQYERAYAKLGELREQDHVRIDPWLYDIFIVVFGQEGFMDELLQLLQHRKYAKGTDDPFRSQLLHCLDLFSQSFHYDGTAWIWDSAVKNGLLNPSSGVIENVLATAARHGDPKLATEALDMISSRGRTSRFHYESVIDAFAKRRDMAGVLQSLSILENTGVKVDRQSTRYVFEALRGNPDLIDGTVSMMRKVREESRVHPEMVNVTLEAMVRSDVPKSAISALYEDFQLLSCQEISPYILRDMILNITDAEMIRSMIKKYMALMGTKLEYEHPLIYDKAIQVCADAGDFDFAFSLAKRNIDAARQSKPGKEIWRDRPWVPYLIQKGIAAEDDRVWEIVDEVKKIDDQKSEHVDLVLTRQKLAAKLAQSQVSGIPVGDVSDEAAAKVQTAIPSNEVRLEKVLAKEIQDEASLTTAGTRGSVKFGEELSTPEAIKSKTAETLQEISRRSFQEGLTRRVQNKVPPEITPKRVSKGPIIKKVPVLPKKPFDNKPFKKPSKISGIDPNDPFAALQAGRKSS